MTTKAEIKFIIYTVLDLELKTITLKFSKNNQNTISKKPANKKLEFEIDKIMST